MITPKKVKAPATLPKKIIPENPPGTGKVGSVKIFNAVTQFHP